MPRPTHEPKHLLDTPNEQNIGNGVIVRPQMTGATVIPQTNPERILMLSGPSGSAQTTSVAITASRIVGSENPNPGYPGPITGVIEFGNGGQFTRVEVDVPIGPFAGYLSQAAPATEPQDGGVIVTVPTGVLRVYARYDNAFILPMINTSSPQSLAQLKGVPFLGPGGPVQVPNPSPPPAAISIPPEPIRAKAMAAYYSRHTSKVYRTQYLYVGDRSFIIPTTITLTNESFFCVPPFARSLKVLRYGTSGLPLPALIITLHDNAGHILDTISVTAGTLSPILPIVGTETIVGISGGVVSLLAFCYEIGI